MSVATRLRAAGPAAWLVAGQLAFLASGYVVNVVAGRVLGPADYGLLGVVLVLTTAMYVVQGQGVPQALARAVASDPAREGVVWRGALRVQRVATVAVALVVVVLAPLLAALLDEPRLLALVLLAALTAPGQSLLMLAIGLANGRRAFRRQGLLLVLYSLARVVAVPLATLAAGVRGAVLAWAFAPLAVAAWAYRERPPVAPPGALDEVRREAAALVRYALPSVLLAGAVTLVMTIDLPAVRGAVADPAASGHYAAAGNVARIAYFLVLPLGLALFPTVAAAAADRARLAATASWGLEVAIAAGAILAAMLVAQGGAVLELAFGADYAVAAPAVTLLAPAIGALAVASVVASAIAATGRPWLALVLPAAGLALQAALVVPLARRHGIEGAAAATLCGAALALVLALGAALRVLGARVAPRRLVAHAVAAAVAYGIARAGATPLLAVPSGLLALAAALAVLRLLRALPATRPAAG